MKRVAATLRRHLDGLINYVTHPLTNGLTEGINSLIAVLKGSRQRPAQFQQLPRPGPLLLGRLDMLPAV